MRPPLVVALLFALALLLVAGPARAECPCHSESPFDLFDRADRVVVARIASASYERASQGGRLVLAVERALKGDVGATVGTREPGGGCEVGFRDEHRFVVFLDRRGEVVGGYQGYVVIDDDAWPEALARWGAAGSDEQRLDVLVDAIAGAAAVLQSRAALTLVNAPQLLARVDDARRARLVAAVADEWQPSYLLLVLTRLRAPELPAILETKIWAYEDRVRTLVAETAAAKLSDPATLARMMIDGARSGRVAALERCEQVQGRRLHRFDVYLQMDRKAAWRRAASACRTGRALTAAQMCR